MDMLPKAGVKCHRTFANPNGPTDCRVMVCDHGCRLWKHVTLEADPATPPGHAVMPVDHWDCADSLVDLYLHDMLRRQLQTTATVDKAAAAVDTLRKEVKAANDGQMVGAIAHLNNRLAEQSRQIANKAAAPLMIAQD